MVLGDMMRGEGDFDSKNSWESSRSLRRESESERSAQSEFTPFSPTRTDRFQGGFAPDAANKWVQILERIFRAIGCGDVQWVTYASYMLANEAENWWEMT
ncbi:hypothetical protein Lal_00036402 [Lupinus albus]|nr:hypothetical protein Lal_00036402 [Lupinus albus]